MTMIQPGRYEAKIKNYAVRPVKSGESAGMPAPTIAFSISPGSGLPEETVFWQGSFKEGKPRQFSIEALFHCGLVNPHSFADIADGPAGGALDMDRVVSVTVEHETGTDGKPHPRVKWINPQGGAAFQNAMTKNEFAYFVGTLGLQGELVAVAQKYGVQPERKKESVNDIPF